MIFRLNHSILIGLGLAFLVGMRTMRLHNFGHCFVLLLAIASLPFAVGGCEDDEPTFCTEDLVQCPDGTYVGRTGPNCEVDCSDRGGAAGKQFFEEERTYVHEPEGCTGSPENPGCVDTITFQPDGRAEKLFDDIVASGTYEIMNTTVSVAVPSFSYQAEFTIANNGNELHLGDAVYVLKQ